MGLKYLELETKTRQNMLEEIVMDSDNYYRSKFLNNEGQQIWLNLLKESVEHDDVWLEKKLIENRCLKQNYYQLRGTKQVRVTVPVKAAQTLAEGEFNYYYLRGLSKRAVNEGITDLEIYRGKEVSNPRPESELKIGTFVNAEEVLTKLRALVPERVNGFVNLEKTFGIPSGGPNSGLTARLAYPRNISIKSSS